MIRVVDKIAGFEPIRFSDRDRPRGYLSRCGGCGQQIIVHHRVRMYCLGCQAEKCSYPPKTFGRFYRSSQWRQMRAAVFSLKGRLCVYCGRPARCVDHQRPISRGGSNTMSNLEPVCTTCNVMKHDKTHAEFLALRSVDNA